MASPALPFATYHFRNIPAHFNEKSFDSIVPLADGRERILNASLAPNSYLTVKADQVRTIIFSTIPRAIAQLKLKESESIEIPLPINSAGAVCRREWRSRHRLTFFRIHSSERNICAIGVHH